MTETQFETLVNQRLEKIKQTLIEKGREYRRNQDPLHNFKRAAETLGTTREKALWGFATKHLVSFLDILDDVDQGKLSSIHQVDEKIGDLINYLILCEASLKDRL